MKEKDGEMEKVKNTHYSSLKNTVVVMKQINVKFEWKKNFDFIFN